MKDKIVNKFKKCKEKIKPYFSFLNKKNKFNLMEVIAIMIITVIFGMFAGGLLMYRKGTLNTGIKKELNEFVDTYTEILNEYYIDVEEEGLLEAGINGMINYLGDPYSVYMDSDAASEFSEKVNGEYVGIGTEIIQYTDGKVEIKDAYVSGPAYEAGLRNLDQIIKINGQSIEGKTLTEISNIVKGKEGTTVKITILRESEELEFTVKRKSIDITSVSSELIEYNDFKIGYIAIDIFAANTKEQFEKQLNELEEKNIESLIIDVRGNSGGYLSTVTDILSLFLNKGDVIYQLKTKDEIEKITDKTKESRDYQIAILINTGSASASEVLTAALKENKEAFVVGTRSYGKSKVQKTQDLSNGATIKYTYQEWLTPNGESVGDKGITPQYEVVYEAANIDNPYDSQLQKALELLTKKENNNEDLEENQENSSKNNQENIEEVE